MIFAGFLGELETLLKEETLVGRGRQCQTELRPLAFSMLAELVHHVRQDLTFAHLSRVIYLFARSALLQPTLLHFLDPASCSCGALIIYAGTIKMFSTKIAVAENFICFNT